MKYLLNILISCVLEMKMCGFMRTGYVEKTKLYQGAFTFYILYEGMVHAGM